jgi:hypothetical protein
LLDFQLQMLFQSRRDVDLSLIPLDNFQNFSADLSVQKRLEAPENRMVSLVKTRIAMGIVPTAALKAISAIL